MGILIKQELLQRCLSITNYLIANNKIPLKSVTFKSSPIAIPIFCNNFCLKLYSIAYVELTTNLKPVINLLRSESKSATHYKETITTLYTKPVGVRLRLERCIAYNLHIMLQLF
jgi:hypothetical protein